MPRILSNLLLLLATQIGSAQYRSTQLPLGPNGNIGTLHHYKFSNSTHTLKVIAQNAGQTTYRNLDSAMRAHASLAGVSGGPTLRNGQPLGLVIANGRVTGTQSQQTPATLYIEEGSIRLISSSVFQAKKKPLPRDVIQTGPFLITSGKAQANLNTRTYSRHTFIATDGRGTWILAYTPPCTQSQLAKVLSSNKIDGIRIQYASILNSGSASGLWINRPNTPLYFREANRLHNYLGITKR